MEDYTTVRRYFLIRMDEALDGMFDILTDQIPYIAPVEIAETVAAIVNPKNNGVVDNIRNNAHNVHGDNIAPIDEDFVAREDMLIDEIIGLAPIVIPERPKVNTQPIPAFNPDNNMVDDIVRDWFKSETVFEATELFTTPVTTTITTEGYLSNVQFRESELIEELEPDEDFVVIQCNFGTKTYPGYEPPVKIKRSNRGRKKKPVKERKRKKQGTGECFNSQITFVMPSTVAYDPTVDTPRVYKFKVFRTGKIQLPGLRLTSSIDDIIVLATKLVNMMNFHLHTCEQDPTKLAKLVNLNPVMKNYKFRVNQPSDNIIDLRELQRILITCQRGSIVKDHPEIVGIIENYPKILEIKYARQYTKLSVKFRTPTARKAKKKVRVNIFQTGKVNILGGHATNVTRQICEFLHWIFMTFRYQLSVRLGSAEPIPEYNIANDDSIYSIMNEYTTPHIDTPHISDAEYELISELVERDYTYNMLEANKVLFDICPELLCM